MRRRTFVGLGAGSVALSCADRGRRELPERPNVILLITDDQGYGDLACHGNPIAKTPNLDRLHHQSVRFTHFHVDPTCAPTRAALMTGRYSHRAGVWHTIMGRNFLHRDEITMADVFRASGYRTGIFGKWHLGGNYPYRPIDRGFDEWVGHGDGGTGTTTDYWGNDKLNDTYLRNGRWEKFEGFSTDIYFNEAMRFIRRAKDGPFFVYLPTNVAHKPWNLPREIVKPFLAKGLNEELAHFYGTIARLDYNLGRLRQFLTREGLAENTILLFTTDNGTACSSCFNAGMRGRKGSQYDGGHRTPLFLHWPAGPFGASRDIGRIAAHVDVLPTLIDICRLERTNGVHLDGQSLLPLITGGDSKWPDRVLMVESQRIVKPEKWRKHAMMTDRWRLVDGRELYDMSSDPGQTEDVAASHPEIVNRLRTEYERLWPEISNRDNEFARPLIGSEAQKEIVLTCHDWIPTEGPLPWNQTHILAGLEANGFWPVEIARDGRYRFALRRWPKEANQAIRIGLQMPASEGLSIYAGAPAYEPVLRGKALPLTTARLRIGGAEQTQPIPLASTEVVFEVELKAGPAKLETRFITGDETCRGAYYVYVERA